MTHQTSDLAALARTVLGHLRRPYPFKPGHIFSDGETSADPRVLSPVFCGSFDWHSSVHSHWTLARLLRADVMPEEITAALATSFAPERVTAELAQLDRPHRRGFELPYGIAWLLTLCAETASEPLGDPLALLWPLARQRFSQWLKRLPCPIRSGEHSQSAFAMSLVIDAAQATGDDELARLVGSRAKQLYIDDRDGPIRWEPSAYDFLSPTLAEADLMRRVLGSEFNDWFDSFLPNIELIPIEASDRADGKLAHADGLNLSRAWMLGALAEHRPNLAPLAKEHRDAGMAGLAAATYAGTHWLPTFAVYLELGAR